jgi:type I restriction enzyme, S subunit
MSNEEGPMANAAQPELRFPEFSGQALHTACLGDVTDEPSLRNHGRLPAQVVMGVRKEEGIVPMEGRLIAADTSRYKVVEKDWFAYNPMRLNIGSISRWHGDDDVLVSPDYVVFRCLDKAKPTRLLPAYLDQFRRTQNWDAFVNGSGDGGVRVRIYYRDLSRMRMNLPDIAEQTKIAECLESVDELIAAENDRLALLVEHKLGLMQRMFPTPGKTSPELRFPEFSNAGGWAWKSIGEIAKIHKGKGISKSDIAVDGDQPCIRYGELYTTYGEIIDTVNSKTNLPMKQLDASKNSWCLARPRDSLPLRDSGGSDGRAAGFL